MPKKHHLKKHDHKKRFENKKDCCIKIVNIYIKDSKIIKDYYTASQGGQIAGKYGINANQGGQINVKGGQNANQAGQIAKKGGENNPKEFNVEN
ncbi:hypothetical protein ACTWQL_23780 [Pseudalkalibacillus sp. R45]|uniref:hypothetical protein n=1 Tax=Pseudalkalibacillus sp. R45 TaxID=3457433 RepID=UPI003FCDD606